MKNNNKDEIGVLNSKEIITFYDSFTHSTIIENHVFYSALKCNRAALIVNAWYNI